MQQPRETTMLEYIRIVRDENNTWFYHIPNRAIGASQATIQDALDELRGYVELYPEEFPSYQNIRR